jgi:hypothetical protein
MGFAHPPIHQVSGASMKIKWAGLSLHFSYALMAGRGTNLPLHCIYEYFCPLRYLPYAPIQPTPLTTVTHG